MATKNDIETPSDESFLDKSKDSRSISFSESFSIDNGLNDTKIKSWR